MTIQERLNKAQESIQELSSKLNTLEQEKQTLLQEILRLDGEIRILTILRDEEQGKEKKL